MGDMQQIYQDALQPVRMDTTQLTQPQALALLNDLATHASNAYVGHFDASLGAQVGGIVWIEAELQALASIPVTMLAGT